MEVRVYVCFRDTENKFREETTEKLFLLFRYRPCANIDEGMAWSMNNVWDAHTESYANNDNLSLSVFIYKSVGRLGLNLSFDRLAAGFHVEQRNLRIRHPNFFLLLCTIDRWTRQLRISFPALHCICCCSSVTLGILYYWRTRSKNNWEVQCLRNCALNLLPVFAYRHDKLLLSKLHIRTRSIENKILAWISNCNSFSGRDSKWKWFVEFKSCVPIEQVCKKYIST